MGSTQQLMHNRCQACPSLQKALINDAENDSWRFSREPGDAGPEYYSDSLMIMLSRDLCPHVSLTHIIAFCCTDGSQLFIDWNSPQAGQGLQNNGTFAPFKGYGPLIN
ncbi:hypothetical protein FRB95_001086 [Tulasnella sp. JGI-2019a]|nr:hypothetical protein FRB95_001086 [Tulasnella sp. JGI-2019a]